MNPADEELKCKSEDLPMLWHAASLAVLGLALAASLLAAWRSFLGVPLSEGLKVFIAP